MMQLYMQFEELRAVGQLTTGISFAQFFEIWAANRRSPHFPLLDDGLLPDSSAALWEKMAEEPWNRRPQEQLQGTIRTMVLLVDFDDMPHQPNHTPFFYKRMLFGESGSFPTGSMREYFHKVSGYNGRDKGIDVQGEVYGWFRMPQRLSYYANQHCGTGREAPRNVQGLARDAVLTALSQGVRFGRFDSLGMGSITALAIIHAGRGAEETGQVDDLWSLKWAIPGGIAVGAGGPSLRAETFMTVPEDCQLGVFAHEWGHLAGQWGNYYSTQPGCPTHSEGLGDYCLMASGAWGNGGMTPVFPHGMLRVYHKWVQPIIIQDSAVNIPLLPAAEGGKPLLIRNPARMSPQQFICVEYRRRQGQDTFLPYEGVAVYTADESVIQNHRDSRMAVELLTDVRQDSLRIPKAMSNREGQSEYPFTPRPLLTGGTHPVFLPVTNQWSGVSLRIHGTPGSKEMSVDISMTT
jgi:immune inhibitor A